MTVTQEQELTGDLTSTIKNTQGENSNTISSRANAAENALEVNQFYQQNTKKVLETPKQKQ